MKTHFIPVLLLQLNIVFLHLILTKARGKVGHVAFGLVYLNHGLQPRHPLGARRSVSVSFYLAIGAIFSTVGHSLWLLTIKHSHQIAFPLVFSTY